MNTRDIAPARLRDAGPAAGRIEPLEERMMLSAEVPAMPAPAVVRGAAPPPPVIVPAVTPPIPRLPIPPPPALQLAVTASALVTPAAPATPVSGINVAAVVLGPVA